MKFDESRAIGKDMTRIRSHDARRNAGSETTAFEESQTTTAQRQNQALDTTYLMELVCERDNLNNAFKRVVGNTGAGGIGGMTVEELEAWTKNNKEQLVASLMNGEYQPPDSTGIGSFL